MTYRWTIRSSTGAQVASLNGRKTQHIFTSKGDYTVQLVVGDGPKTSTKSIVIEVYNPSENPPTAVITSAVENDGRINKGTAVRFDSSNSIDIAPGNIKSRIWEIKKMGVAKAIRSSNEIVLSHTFDTTGDYTVKLTIVDNDNNRHSTELKFTVDDTSTRAPVVSISEVPSSSRLGETLFFAGVAEHTSSLVTYTWDIDGVVIRTEACSNNVNCQTTLQKNDLVKGVHKITYKVKDAANHEGSATVSVDITEVNAPTVSIVRPLGPNDKKQVEFIEGTNIQFEAAANDPDGGTLTYSSTETD